MIKRLKQFIDNQRISVRKFEQNISASNGLIRKAIANNTDIQSKWISNIVDNYPQLNPEWLLTGKGEMLKNNLAYEDENPHPNTVTEAEMVYKASNHQDKIIKLLEQNIAALQQAIRALEMQIEKDNEMIKIMKEKIDSLSKECEHYKQIINKTVFKPTGKSNKVGTVGV